MIWPSCGLPLLRMHLGWMCWVWCRRVGDEPDAETRRNALEALVNVCQTVGIDGLTREQVGGGSREEGMDISPPSSSISFQGELVHIEREVLLSCAGVLYRGR